MNIDCIQQNVKSVITVFFAENFSLMKCDKKKFLSFIHNDLMINENCLISKHCEI